MPTDADKIKELEEKIKKYEGDGPAKLFYSLNRKAAEMADMLNATNLKNLDLTDPKDKTFDRLKVIWNDSTSLSVAIKSLESTAGVTNDEAVDTTNPKYAITTPESISNVLRNTAG